MIYEVIVGNIGSVYRGSDDELAKAKYNEYVEQSRANYGRASGEDVTLFENGEIWCEFIGKNSELDTEK